MATTAEANEFWLKFFLPPLSRWAYVVNPLNFWESRALASIQYSPENPEHYGETSFL